jgi:hypothetical protein
MTYNILQNWQIGFSRKAARQASKLDTGVLAALDLLVKDLKYFGPIPGKHWSNYGKLKGIKSRDRRHCHLIKGSPTYVCCWEVIDKKIKIIEVYYVGTHEKAPY